MKIKLWMVALVIGLVVCGWLGYQILRPIPQQPYTVKVGPVRMLPSTVTVRPDIQNRVAELLKDKAGVVGTYHFAITAITRQGDYDYISVAGIPGANPVWSLENATWLGLVTLVDPSVNPDMPGTVEDVSTDQAYDSTGVGGAGTILPFRSGTTAVYGEAGVHNCGFSLSGWRAVDLFPTENQVYSAEAGEVSYVCRDGTQVALRIGNLLYDHLVDSGQQVGDQYSQGQPLGALVTGSFNTTCGYASQQSTAFHVHWCFIPNSGGTFSADGYALNINNQQWFNGTDTVSIGGSLRASWQNANVTSPGPTAGANLWDTLVSAITGPVQKTINKLPIHQTTDLSTRVIQTIGAPLKLVYTLILSNINLAFWLWAIAIIFILETVRRVLAIILWVKRILPDIIKFFV